ncbi:MAG: penicillin acylase family protein [Actinomycetes bacterium]
MSRRPLFVLLAAGGLACTVFAATAAGAAGSAYDGQGQTMNIVGPGSRGNVSIPDLVKLGVTNLPQFLQNPGESALVTATPTNPKNFDDQWEMYDGLNRVDPASLTDAQLTKYYKDARIGGDPNGVVSTERPRPGLTIRRDSFGVPHIDGATAEDVSYGAGYAGIEDRMFLTDILRHTGKAQMSSFLGPTPGDIAMDQSQLRIAPYTEAEAQAQIAKVAQRYPSEGPALLRRLDAFLAGVNDAQKKLCPAAFGLPSPGNNGGGFGPNCPSEYAVLQKAPTPYTRADIVFIASLVGGIFGKGGGNEFADALWFEALQAKYGTAKATQIYDDLREKDDPEAFTSATTRFAYLPGGLEPGKPGVALPVPGAPAADGTGSDAGSGGPISIPPPPLPGSAAAAKQQASLGKLKTPLGPLDFGIAHHDMSNALLVGAQHSADGHPIAVFGPQTGYFTPQLLDEIDLHGPGIDARGVSFAGTQFVVELGHGADYAWSATSADSDLVDTVMDRLCNPDGSAATIASTHYILNGQCVPLIHYVHSEGVVIPTAGGTGTPETLKFNVYKTVHGIVQLRTLAKDPAHHGDVPVAVVSQRSTYGHEADSVVGFARVNNPDYVHNASDFQHAFSGVDYTFNWFYADNKDIAYFVSGLLPQRPASVEPDLPRWGDGAYDWSGFLPSAGHVQEVDPPRGYTASWNNKQADGFGVADDQWGQSGVHRVNLLVERIEKSIANGRKITRADLVGDMADAATADLRAEKLLPLALRVVGDDPKARPAIALLKKWVADGAHRVDRARTGQYGDQAAIALFDTWWDDNGKASFNASGTDNGGLAKDALRPGLGAIVDQLPYGTDDHPRQHLGSSWDTVAWYGYVSKALRQALGDPVQGAYSEKYCGTLAACRAALRASLETAVARAEAEQDVSSVNALTYDKSIDDIVSVTAGVVGVHPIDWQNRPTFQQVVNFTGHRSGSVTHARTLPTTGMPVAAAVLALVLFVMGGTALRLRRS